MEIWLQATDAAASELWVFISSLVTFVEGCVRKSMWRKNLPHKCADDGLLWRPQWDKKYIFRASTCFRIVLITFTPF